MIFERKAYSVFAFMFPGFTKSSTLECAHIYLYL